MKKRIVTMVVASMLSAVICPSVARADWTYGSARFSGDRPTNSRNRGGVLIYYNGVLKEVGREGNTELWECTGDVCIIYPRNYSGPRIRFIKSAGVQEQHL